MVRLLQFNDRIRSLFCDHTSRRVARARPYGSRPYGPRLTVHRPGQVDKDRSVGTRPIKRQHRAMGLRTPVDHPFKEFGTKAPSRPPCGIGTMDLRPSTIVAARCGSTVCRIVGWKNLRAAENAL